MSVDHGTSPETSTSVLGTLRAAHDRLMHALDATASPPRPGDPRAGVRALDEVVSALCEHLGAVEQVLHPAARRHVTDAKPLLSSAGSSARGLERTMRRAEQSLWGDARSRAGSAAEFAAQLQSALRERRRYDERLGAALDEALDEPGRRELTARLVEAVRHAPTRPHPHRPHLGRLDPVSLRILAWWDDVLDGFDVRGVPDRGAHRDVPAPTRWSAYAMGSGLPKDERR